MKCLTADEIATGEYSDVVASFGQKAAGLLLVPKAWRPAFAVISAGVFDDWLGNGDALTADALEAIDKLIVDLAPSLGMNCLLRSSATDETLNERGNYLSLEVDLSAGSAGLAAAAQQIFENYRVKGGQGKMCLILQRRILASNQGYLSNELRMVDKPYRWIVETEIRTVEGRIPETTSISAKQGADFSTDNPLICTSIGELRARLRSVAKHFWKSAKGRLLLEWCWDGSRLWIVQRDQTSEKAGGINPFELLDKGLSAPALEDGQVFRRHQPGSSSPWPKLRKVASFGTGIAPPPHRLFYGNAARVRTALSTPASRAALVDEINALTNGRAVIRTDTTIGGYNLPRTNTVDGRQAVEWLAEKLDGIDKDADTVFILHAFIHAKAAAWSYYKRGDGHVRVDGLWGLADGMQYYPCDTFVYYPKSQKEIETLRFKGHVLLETAGGKWDVVDVDQNFARKRSLTKAQVSDIAQRTIEIAERTQADAQIMWFSGVPPQFSLGENLPWFTATAEQNIIETRSHLLRSIVISHVDDLTRLSNIAPNSVKVILTPSGEDIRSDAFIDAVGEVCRERNLPVEIQGSILSHAYHQLARAGVHVFCAEPGKTQPALRQRKSFDKLVRDQIPQHIESRGESVTSARIDTEELERALIAKLLEETTEFLTAKPGAAKSEELADMLEVLRGLASTSNVTFAEIESKADKKRIKRGGFELGVILRSTNLAFDEETETLFSEIKHDLRSRVRLSDLSDHAKRSDKATLPIDRLLSNEVVRRSLQHGQQSATIRAEMEAGNVVLTLEHVVDLGVHHQPDLLQPEQ